MSPGEGKLGPDEHLEAPFAKPGNQVGIGQFAEIHDADAIEHHVAKRIDELPRIRVHDGQMEINQHVSPPLQSRAANYHSGAER